jgi:hypothetical protein
MMNQLIIEDMAETVGFLAYDYNKQDGDLIVEFLDVYEEFGYPVVGVA